MSLVTVVMIAGWTGSAAVIAFFALKESGKLLNLRDRVASWLEPADAKRSSALQNDAYSATMELE